MGYYNSVASVVNNVTICWILFIHVGACNIRAVYGRTLDLDNKGLENKRQKLKLEIEQFKYYKEGSAVNGTKCVCLSITDIQ